MIILRQKVNAMLTCDRHRSNHATLNHLKNVNRGGTFPNGPRYVDENDCCFLPVFIVIVTGNNNKLQSGNPTN